MQKRLDSPGWGWQSGGAQTGGERGMQQTIHTWASRTEALRWFRSQRGVCTVLSAGGSQDQVAVDNAVARQLRQGNTASGGA